MNHNESPISNKGNLEIPIEHFVFSIPKEKRGPILEKKLTANLVGYKTFLDNAQEFVKKELVADRKAVYQFKILNELIKTGEIDTLKLEKTLREENPDAFSPATFNMACKKVRDYAERVLNSISTTKEKVEDKQETKTLEMPADKKDTLTRILQLEQRRMKLINTLESITTEDGLKKIQEEIDRCEDTIAILKRFVSQPE